LGAVLVPAQNVVSMRAVHHVTWGHPPPTLQREPLCLSAADACVYNLQPTAYPERLLPNMYRGQLGCRRHSFT
jgi:hypothetical protein